MGGGGIVVAASNLLLASEAAHNAAIAASGPIELIKRDSKEAKTNHVFHVVSMYTTIIT
jgi:hypothetical protein